MALTQDTLAIVASINGLRSEFIDKLSDSNTSDRGPGPGGGSGGDDIAGLEKKARAATTGLGKFADEIGNSGYALKSAVTGISGDFEKAGKSITSGAGGLEASFGAISSIGGSLGMGMTTLTKSMMKGSKTAEEFEEALENGNVSARNMNRAFKLTTVALGLMSVGIGMIVKLFSGMSDGFNQMAGAGATFGSNLLEMKRASDQANMGLEEFGKYVVKNIKPLTQLGGSATQGAKQLANVGASIRNSGLDRTFMSMGINGAEQLEVAQGYMRIQQMTGAIQTQNTAEIAKGSEGYAKSLKMLGELTGDSVEEQMKANEALAQDAAFRAKLRGMDADEAANYQKTVQVMTSMYGEAGGQMAKEMLVTGDVASAQSAELAAMAPSARGMIESMKDASTQGKEAFVAGLPSMMKSFESEINKDLNNLTEIAKNTIYSKDGPMATVAKIFSPMADSAASIGAMSVAELEKHFKTLGTGDDTMKASITVQKEMLKVMHDLREMGTKLMTSLQPGLLNAIKSLVGWINSGIEALGPGGFLGAVGAVGLALFGLKTFVTTKLMSMALGGAGPGTGLAKVGDTAAKASAGIGGKLLGTVSKFLGPVSTALMVGKDAVDIVSDVAHGRDAKKEDIGGVSGGVAGAIIGGILGSVIPGAGTIAGAALGGAIGNWAGDLVGGMMDEEDQKTVTKKSHITEENGVITENSKSVSETPGIGQGDAGMFNVGELTQKLINETAKTNRLLVDLINAVEIN